MKTDGSKRNMCPICQGINIQVFLEIDNVPIYSNRLWTEREKAIRAPRGDIQLGFCLKCGHIFNVAFNPELIEYTKDYDNSLYFSSFFQKYATSLASELIEHYDLRGKTIIEIGCGKGDFLSLLCRLGNNLGIGFDQSYVPNMKNNDRKINEEMIFIQDFYSDKYAHYKANFICCRHVLEHIQSPVNFLETIRYNIDYRLKTGVFFEVPNVLFTLRDQGIWDLIYEHYSYFSPYSLNFLFNSCGFKVCNIREMYQGQYLCLEALPVQDPKNTSCYYVDVDLKELTSYIKKFAERYGRKMKVWQRELKKIEKAGQKVVIWGAGSKGVNFLNILETQDQIYYIVDINPRKQGKYIAGSGQKIVPPEFLLDYQPDVVIIMNPIYQDEIKKALEKIDLVPNVLYA